MDGVLEVTVTLNCASNSVLHFGQVTVDSTDVLIICFWTDVGGAGPAKMKCII